jgi:hypothetical protein
VRKVTFLATGEDVDGERYGEASRVQTVEGLKGYMNSMLEPARRGARIALTIP